MSTSIEDRLSAAGQELDRRIAARVSAARPAADHDVARRPVRSPRPMWAWVCAGGVAIAGLVTGVVLLTRDGTRSITPATSTTVPVTTSIVSTTTEPAPSSSSTPSVSAPVSSPATTMQLTDVWRDGSMQRTVLYSAEVGDAVDQLGVEDCRECEPTTPWTPVALADGTLVIADLQNSRWIVVRNGAPTAHPFPEGRIPIAQPVADDNGTIYSVDGYYQPGPAQVAVVSVYPGAEMSAPAQQVEFAANLFARIRLTSTAILVNDQPVPGLTPSVRTLPEVTYSLNRFPATIEVSWDNRIITWGMPPTDFSASSIENNARPDGIVLLSAWDYGANAAYIVALHPDGTAVRAPITGTNIATNGSTSADASGIIRLERVDTHLEVAHYILPS